MLPEEWLQRYGGLAQLGEADGEAVQVRARRRPCCWTPCWPPRNAGPGAGRSSSSPTFRQKLRSFDGVRPRHEPRGFTGQLRGYQQDGLGWLHFLRDFRFGGCLADDMGLGKTVQVLALLEARRTRPTGRRPDARHRRWSSCPRAWCSTGSTRRPRFTPQLRVLNYTGLGTGAAAGAPGPVRPGGHHLRHAAPRHRRR